MKRKFRIIFLGLSLCLSNLYSDVLFFSDFETESGIPSVVFGQPELSNVTISEGNSLEFEAKLLYEQIRIPLNTASPMLYVSFNLMTQDLLNSDYAFTMLMDTPQVRNLSFHGGLNQIYSFPANHTRIPYIDNKVYFLETYVDFSRNRWEILVDGVSLGFDTINASGINSLRFSMSPWTGAADSDAPDTKVFIDDLLIATSDQDVPGNVGQSDITDIQFDNTQIVEIAPGYDHQSMSIPYVLVGNVDDSLLTVESDAPWANPVINTNADTIDISFSTEDLISSYTATVTVSGGSVTKELFISANLSPLNIFKLVDDPVRSKVYGIHRNGLDEGAIIAFDPINESPIKCLTVGKNPTDFVINDASSELLVINAVSKTIDVIDLVTFTVKETINLTTYSSWGDDDDTSANIELGPDNIIYYVDGSWGPILHVYDRSLGSVLQSIKFDGEPPSNSTGFGDIVVNSSKTGLYAWSQYGWSAGSAGSSVARYEIASDGTVNFVEQNNQLSYPEFRRDPMESPALIQSDNDLVFLKTVAIDTSDVQNIVASFPSEVWAISPNGEMVSTADSIYETSSGLELYKIQGASSSNSGSYYIYSKACIFTTDYTRYLYFDNSDNTLKVVNLIDEIGLDLIGRSLNPANGAIITSPQELIWSPTAGIYEYDLYLGISEIDVETADSGSSEYIGRVSGTLYNLFETLNSGMTYYWRVDPVSEYGAQKGPIYSFRVSDVSLDVSELNLTTVEGHKQLAAEIILESAGSAVSWSASATQPWVQLTNSSGSTPDTLEINLDASLLDPNTYGAMITIATASGNLDIPLTLRVEPLHLTLMESDRNSSIVYAVSEDSASISSKAYLLEVDAASEEILRVIEVGSSVTDIAIHYTDNLIYVTNWQSGNLIAVDRTSMTKVKNHAFKPFAGTGYGDGDAYVVSAGVSKRLVVEEEDQWIDISIYNTETSTVLNKAFVREGGGQFGPTGQYYFHGENNSSGASIQKFDTTGDQFNQLKEVRPSGISYYGSRTVTISEDGSRVFWAGAVLDADLNLEWLIQKSIYSATPDGRYAFSNESIFDVNTRRVAFHMPENTRVSAYNSTAEKLVAKVGDGIGFFDFSDPTLLAAPVLSGIVDGTTIHFEWEDSSLETGFSLQQRLVGGSVWTDVTTTSSNVTQYTVNGLNQNQAYEFRIRAISTDYSSSWSQVVSLKTESLKPSTPSLYNLISTATTVSIDWSDSTHADCYTIERSLLNSSPWNVVNVICGAGSNYLDDSVSPVTTYYYRVKATNSTKDSDYSNVQSITTKQLPVPSTPTALSVEIVDANELLLKWVDSIAESGYRIQRRTEDPNSWSDIVELSANVTSYSDTTVEEGTEYWYRVIAFNEIGDSIPTSSVKKIPMQIVHIFSDDFDPSWDSLIWSNVIGGQSLNGGIGFLSSNSLWFGASLERSATTEALNLRDSERIIFDMRAGNQDIDGNQYWNNSETNEEVYLEYSIDGSTWQTIKVINTVYPALTAWTRFQVDIPQGARAAGIYLRWIQKNHSGQNYDSWAIDNLAIEGQLPQLPETPGFIITSASSSSQITVYWANAAHAQAYVIERKSVFSDWIEIGEINSSKTYFVDNNLLPSSLYSYKVKARNSNGDSIYTYIAYAETWSEFEEWLLLHFNTSNAQELPLDISQEEILRKFAFNMNPYRAESVMDKEGVSGLPVHNFNSHQGAKKLTTTFVRRVNSSLTYIAEFSDNLIDWESSNNIIEIEVIDDGWERVTIEDNKVMGKSRFARVVIENQ